MHPTPKDAVNLWTAGFATSAVIQGLVWGAQTRSGPYERHGVVTT